MKKCRPHSSTPVPISYSNYPKVWTAVAGEQGTGLSEGQSQRIAIARALLRPSGILLFDEATSSLDTATEKRLWQNICNHYGNKTLIFVTHRVNIITSETRILKLSK